MFLPSIIHYSQPRATNDIDSDDIVLMTEDNREPSRKRSITYDNRSDDIKHQEDLGVPPPKKRKRLRDPKIILEDQKKKHLIKLPCTLIDDKMTDIETVTLKYFESGHTCMAADTVHAAIIEKFKRTREVYDFDDFEHNINTSRKNLEVAVLSHKEMIVFSNDSKVAYPKGINIHNLNVTQFR
ncbi:hypothetical protein HHI36_010057 [Cryptolaemus montrouzieri]|uniref:Uncharacterized protein n=1 Tax=Cryptolaemus montrouzieri TaxID=559131 RepID=A0ABD2MHJ5_9CUCU